ncbi:TPA: prefoldin subunit alpha [Candidatus Geothermarchaeota archaeon]|nr:prefoldin subunit alpha [Candidatus Geothermarchaeota archaeon]HIQ13069.1 prefoldin subunit alpha [Thermoprotei archaeon]
MGEDRLSKLVLEQRNITQLMENVYNEIITLQNSVEERRRALQFLEMFSELNKDLEVLFPIGGGLYLKANIPNQKSIFSNVGGQIFLDKEIEEVIPQIKTSLEKLNKLLEERRQLLNSLKTRYDEISAELTEIYFKASGRKK